MRQGRRRAQGSLTPGSGRKTQVSPGRAGPGSRGSPGPSCRGGGEGGELGRSLTVRRRRQCSWRPRPSSCGAAHRPGSAAPRPGSAPPRPARQAGPRPGAAPRARPRHTRPVRNPTRRAPRGRGERLLERASASPPWGTQEADSLPLGSAGREAGGSGRPWVPRSAVLGWAEAVALSGPRAAGLAGLPPLLLSRCSPLRLRTGARSAAILAAPCRAGPVPGGTMAAALQL